MDVVEAFVTFLLAAILLPIAIDFWVNASTLKRLASFKGKGGAFSFRNSDMGLNTTVLLTVNSPVFH